MAPLDTAVEAVYKDGFVLSETDCGDVSPYNPEENILRAILNKDPEAEHGRLVEFSMYYKNQKHTVDWTTLPDNARPIRFRTAQLERDLDTGQERFSWLGVNFGYQFTNELGKNIKEIKEL